MTGCFMMLISLTNTLSFFKQTKHESLNIKVHALSQGNSTLIPFIITAK